MDTGNQARQESQLRLRLCVFASRSGWVNVLCGFWLVLLTALYHGAVWAAFPLSDKQPQSLPSSKNQASAASLFFFLLSSSERLPSNERHPMVSGACRLHAATAKGLSHEFTVERRDFSPPRLAHIIKLNSKRKERRNPDETDGFVRAENKHEPLS